MTHSQDKFSRSLAAAQGTDSTQNPADFADGPSSDIGRRELFKVMGASMALASMGGCIKDPGAELLPYVEQPPEVTPGMPLYYATSLVRDGFATGVLVQTREGRPIKIEGNPEHPASLGAAGVFEQAAVLGLYDPDRARAALRDGLPASWQTFFEQFRAGAARGGLWFLLHPHTSPLIAHLMARISAGYPGVRFACHSPLHRGQVYRGASQVFGRSLEAQYDFGKAETILALDADFLACMPMSLRWARQFAQKRRLLSPAGHMNRLYAIESMPSATGSLADHRLRARPGEVSWLAARVLAALAAAGMRPPDMPGDMAALLDNAGARTDATLHEQHTSHEQQWIAAVARDLSRTAGTSIVIAGDGQPAETHMLAHLINAALGNLGTTIRFTEPALIDAHRADSLAQLIQAMDAGQVDSLIILDANPVYTAPVDLDFAGRLPRVPLTAHVSLYYNETSQLCRWFLPAAHELESWGDARAYDGTLSFIQPLIQPLYQGRSTAEILAAFAETTFPAHSMAGYDLLRTFWRPRLAAAPSFETAWERTIQRGFVAGSAAPVVDARLPWSPGGSSTGSSQEISAALARLQTRPRARGLEIGFVQSPKVYDGRYANNGWLQELPHPVTKLTWDNAAIMSPRTARELAVSTQDVIELRTDVGAVRAPVLVLPGHADDAVTLALGYGRQGTESLARGAGVNAYAVRSSNTLSFAAGVRAIKTGATYPLARTQKHWTLHGRELVLHSTLAGYRANPGFTASHREPMPSLLPEYRYTGQQWAMAIDTSICSGCSACVIACQAENNIALVGKQGVQRSREMHWLRIDSYYVDPYAHGRDARNGDREGSFMVHQPMMCQHCEKAPCEYVCPVNATVHSPDGLNEMVYNRCIGTRFCSNNCPYKVRRFNWFEYIKERTTVALQRNPDVTVRERGVMEKCTYCVQRIRRAEIQARIERRELAGDEVVTACQQACPMGAIVFGSLDQKASDQKASDQKASDQKASDQKASDQQASGQQGNDQTGSNVQGNDVQDSNLIRMRRQLRSYAVLHDQGARPRTTYLAKIYNPNPEID